MSSHNVAVSGDKQDQENPFPPRALATPGTGQPDVTIDMLHDDILLEIFDSYRKLVIWIEGILYWQKLLYVCRRWRYLILGSARHLDLQIRCFRNTHARKLLDTWPAIPISIICRPSTRVGTRGNHNIIAALQRRNRISQIEFSSITRKEMEQFAAAMDEPFLFLTDLRIHIHEPTVTVELPDSFLGGSAPRLESFDLGGASFPALTNLALSSSHFHQLHLHGIPRAGYIPPEAMVTFLLPLHNLKGLTIEFDSHKSCPIRMSPPPSTHALLPSLTSFQFDGASDYLVDFIARIDTPMLDSFRMTLYSDVIPNILQMHKFIDRADRLKTFTHAEVSIHRWDVTAIFGSCADSDLGLDITCKVSLTDSPLLSILRLYEQFPAIPSQVEQLKLYEESLDDSLEEMGVLLDDDEEGWECDKNDPQWLELLIPFVSVKTLYVSEGLGLYLASALGNLRGERVAEVLPTLDNLFLEGLRSSGFVVETITPFVILRQLSGRPVTLQPW